VTDKNWKAVERRVAKKTGGIRIALSGRNNMGKKGDVDLVGYLTEAKSGRQVPKTVIAWLQTVRELATEDEIPILVMQPKHLKEMVVALTLTDFVRVRDGGRENGKLIEQDSDEGPGGPITAGPAAANPAAQLMQELRTESAGLRTAHAISEGRNQRAFQIAVRLKERVIEYENSGPMDIDPHGHKVPRGRACVQGARP
jgi:hypothetical protein